MTKEYIRFILQAKLSIKCPTLNNSKSEVNFWKLLRVFENKVRVEIVKSLLQFEMMSLSDVARKLEEESGQRMTLPGLLKHIKILEDAGIVQKESGAFLSTPDARKTIYLLEGKQRVKKKSWSNLRAMWEIYCWLEHYSAKQLAWREKLKEQATNWPKKKETALNFYLTNANQKKFTTI